MGDHRAWLAAARPERALFAPLSVAVGLSYAHFDAQRGPGLPSGVLVTLGAFAAALGVNLVDHAWDRLQAPPPDPKVPAPEPFRPVDAREAGAGAVAAVSLATICGFGLVPLSGASALEYGVLAVILGLARAVPQLGLDTLGWGLGETACVVALGPLAAMAGFASQAGSGSFGALIAGLPAGLIALAGLGGRNLSGPALDWGLARQRGIAFPLLAAAAVTIAARAGEYGPGVQIAAVPLAIAAAAAWRLPASPKAADYARWERWALWCAVAALASVVVALRFASSE